MTRKILLIANFRKPRTANEKTENDFHEMCQNLLGRCKESGKELAISKSEIGDLLKEAVAHHASCEEARWRTENLSHLALFHAWQAGIRFNRIKKLVGHGHWQSWLKNNNVGISERTVQLYMKIDNDNPHMRLMKPNPQR